MEFETTVKNYKYSEDFLCGEAGLTVKGKFIDFDFIDYLEIDDHVLIDRGGAKWAISMN